MENVEEVVWCDCDEESLQNECALLQTQTCTSLSIEKCSFLNISDDTVENFINILKSNSSLKSFSIGHDVMIDIVPILGALSSNNTLTTLTLSTACFASLGHLLRSNKTLSQINLNCGNYEGLHLMAASLEENTSLQTLEIRDLLPDSQVYHLCEIISKGRHLQRITVGGLTFADNFDDLTAALGSWPIPTTVARVKTPGNSNTQF